MAYLNSSILCTCPFAVLEISVRPLAPDRQLFRRTSKSHEFLALLTDNFWSKMVHTIRGRY
jgi:hypothetical protein